VRIFNEIKTELSELRQIGESLLKSLSEYKNENKFNFFINNYEQWYSKALVVIKQLMPDRLDDFVLLYRNDKRKGITDNTYTISDAIQSISCIISKSDIFDLDIHYGGPEKALSKLNQQLSMVAACCERLDSKLYDMKILLQSEIFDNEIETARHLLKNGHIRAAGAICGVIIESHFEKVAENHKIKMNKKAPTIADYNDTFKDVIYDTIQWRFIQRLGDIRNLCVHKKNREPTKDEIEEFINGTDKLIKTIF